MKNKRRHWLDLDKKERKAYKKAWNKTSWHKALTKAYFAEGDTINILLIASEFILGILIFAYFEILIIDIQTIYLLCSIISIIFIPTLLISGVSFEETEFKKWLKDKYDIIK